MKKIADLWYLLELSANMIVSPYFEVAESEYDIYFTQLVDLRVEMNIQVALILKNEDFSR